MKMIILSFGVCVSTQLPESVIRLGEHFLSNSVSQWAKDKFKVSEEVVRNSGSHTTLHLCNIICVKY